jgi:hypothetical protein
MNTVPQGLLILIMGGGRGVGAATALIVTTDGEVP